MDTDGGRLTETGRGLYYYRYYYYYYYYYYAHTPVCGD